MRLMKRWLSSVLCLLLLLGLLPMAALAAGGTADWADPAVKVLNEIYGSGESGPFSASTDVITEGETARIASSVGWTTTKLTSESSTQLSRSKACAVLAEVFALPVGEEENAAITYLYEQNIVNGKSEDNLGAADPVSFAEFAVLTYRVLNSVGGGKTKAGDTFKPGDNGYFEWMYLAARGCVPFQSNQMDTAIAKAKLTNVGQNSVADAADAADAADGVKSGETLWAAWIARLNTLKNVGWGEGESVTKPAYPSDATNTTLLTAAKSIVTAYINAGGSATIFSDVVQGDYDNGGAYYDGVMYLFDQHIVSGQGDGTFGMQELLRYQLAALLARLDNQNLTLPKAIEYAVTTKGYMTGDEVTEDWAPSSAQNGDPWLQTATREEAIVAVMKQQQGQKADNVNLANVNTAALDRFDDCDSHTWINIENAEKYVAFAVSRGLVNGTGTSLGLSTGTTRGEIGVLVYRVLIGLDASKMHDYEQNVQNALG